MDPLPSKDALLMCPDSHERSSMPSQGSPLLMLSPPTKPDSGSSPCCFFFLAVAEINSVCLVTQSGTFLLHFPGLSLVCLSHVCFVHPDDLEEPSSLSDLQYPLFISCFVCLHLLPESVDQFWSTLCHTSFSGPGVLQAPGLFSVLPPDLRAVSHSPTYFLIS